MPSRDDRPFLFRLGRLAFRRRGLFVLLRTVDLAAVAIGGSTVYGKTQNGLHRVAAVTLVITFGSLLAAGLPLVTAAFGVGTAIIAG